MFKNKSLDSLRNNFDLLSIDALIIFSPVNIEWLTGFKGSNGCVFISKKDNILATDSRYQLQAKEETNEWKIRIGNRHGTENISQIIIESKLSKIAILEDEISLKNYHSLIDSMHESQRIILLKDVDNPILKLRMRKNSNEIKMIQQSAQLASEVIEFGIKNINSNTTEKNLADNIEIYAKKLGAEKMSFETIVASGARAAMPHAKPTSHTIEKNTMVLIDMGVYLNGYASDITRTFWNGKKDQKFDRLYTLVKLAQSMASERAESKMLGKDIHAIAETIFNEANINDLFIHGLGHGIGKEVHEKPYLDKDSNDILATGSIVTIEPGIYIQGWGGIRIEDMFEVTDTGLRQLTTANK